MMNPLSEMAFEDHIVEQLSSSPLYVQRQSNQFDIPTLVDRMMLEAFLRQQPKVWAMLTQYFPGHETDTVVAEYNKMLNRGESILRILTKGITIKGKTVKFVQFKPVLDGPESDNYKLYQANRFSVVKEMRYSTESADSKNRLDLCILVNGIPLMTFELKNEQTGQCYSHGIYQYRYERNPENRMLRNCLVHFVMDNNYVFMTTRLDGEQTRFLPFNRDSKNPPIPGDYPTAYMWQDILQADSLLDIIENFIKRYNENGNPVVIFPRFHQLRAVRAMRRYVREEGPGHNYLIQHSAGSGKTKSMAWLAHQLANMTNVDRTPIFDSIIMVTDRIVLNRNMADDVVNFQTVAGTVKDIRRGSKNLAVALNEGHRIIISTVQKFAFALKDLKREKSRKYAIIVDEAHTAIGNESAKDLMNALSTDEDLRNVPNFNPDEWDDEVDALMAYMQVMRRMMGHISYFAFTATPKDKTYALFGKDGHSAHDLYSMKQAIDEKFILDVIKYYKSYQTMFELIEKAPDADKQKYFEEKKSLRVIYADLNKNAYIMLRKAQMMLDHFMHHTINKIGHRAKAMVVTDSRRAAADYKRLLDRLIAEQYDGKIKTLVAFSGEVEDSHGRKCTEANMNEDGVYDDGIRLKFKEDDFKILIVAEKFQTGFDQPLLHTMYVDRSLGGIQCIQTLSRLNRCYPGKEDTMVIDFRNDAEKVQKAFQAYYTETTLEGEPDTQRLYSLKDDVDEYQAISEDEIDHVVKCLMDKRTARGVVSYLKALVEERIVPWDDEKKDRFRKLVDRYVRQYGFMAQLMDFTDPTLEKFYVMCRALYPNLPYTKETLPTEIIDLIDLDKLRIQLHYEGQLELEDEEMTMKSARIGEPGKKLIDEKKTIAEILDIANSPYVGILNENDKILKQIVEAIFADQEVIEAFSANNTYDALMNLVKEKFDEKIADQIEKYYNLADVIERDRALSWTVISKIVEALTQRTRSYDRLEYDEEKLWDAIYDAFYDEFDKLCRNFRNFDDFVDQFFYVLNQPSLRTLSGMDDQVKRAINNYYCNPNIDAVDKRSYFTTLVTKYEIYLKKLYYLINNEELPASEPGRTPALSDAKKAFNCLWSLRYSSRPTRQKFSEYLEHLTQWRNSETHLSPDATESQIDNAIKEVVAMYLFVSGMTITDVEQSEATGEPNFVLPSYRSAEEKNPESHLGRGVAESECESE